MSEKTVNASTAPDGMITEKVKSYKNLALKVYLIWVTIGMVLACVTYLNYQLVYNTENNHYNVQSSSTTSTTRGRRLGATNYPNYATKDFMERILSMNSVDTTCESDIDCGAFATCATDMLCGTVDHKRKCICVHDEFTTVENDDIPCRYEKLSRLVAFLLSLSLGTCGVDRFYLSKGQGWPICLGILKLLSLGGLGFWWLVDLILHMTGSIQDGNGIELIKM